MLQPISMEGFKRLRTRAGQGDPDALAELAETYRMGRVVEHESIEPDPQFAEKLWKKAAKAGHPRARERRRIRRSLQRSEGVSKAFDAFEHWIRLLGIAVTLGVAVALLASQSLVWHQTSKWPPIRLVEGLRWIGIDTGAFPGSDAEGSIRILALVLDVPLVLVLLLLGLVFTSLLLRLARLLRPSRLH